MTGGGWAEWRESLAGAVAATPRTTAEGGGAAAGAVLEEAGAATMVLEVQKARAGGLQGASRRPSGGSGLEQNLLGGLRSWREAADTVLGVSVCRWRRGRSCGTPGRVWLWPAAACGGQPINQPTNQSLTPSHVD